MYTSFINFISRIKLFRLFAGVTQALWGVSLLIWPSIFSSGKSFVYMSEKAPQYVWGWGILFVALLYLHSLFVSKAHLANNIIKPDCLWYYRIGSYTSLFLWFIIAGMLISSNYQSTGTVMYSMVTLFYALELIREEV